MVRHILQVLALTVSILLLGFLACRAQSKPANPPDNRSTGAPAADAGVPDAAPDVYLPASKSGGVWR